MEDSAYQYETMKVTTIKKNPEPCFTFHGLAQKLQHQRSGILQ